MRLSEVRKAVAALVGAAITASVAAVHGIDVTDGIDLAEAIAFLAAALGAPVVWKVPNDTEVKR